MLVLAGCIVFVLCAVFIALAGSPTGRIPTPDAGTRTANAG